MSVSKVHTMIKALAAALASVSAFVSCLQVEDFPTVDVGYLELPLLDIDVTVENPAQTKALDGFTVDFPDESEIVYSVKGKDSGTPVDLSSWPLTLPAGKTYIVEASVGENTFGQPYFYASQEVTIQKLTKLQPSLQLSIANSLVRVAVDEALSGHFLSPDGDAWKSSDKVTLTSGSELYEATYGQWTYIPSDGQLTVSLTGRNSVGKEVTFTYSLPATPAAKTGYDITCGKDATNWPTITIPAQQDGAWANRLYVTPGATLSGNIPVDQIEYQVSSDNWASVKTSRKVGDYHVVDGLSNGTTYSVRARIGNIYSEPVSVTVRQDNPVSTAHYNDASGNLAGTDAVINYGFKGILKTLYDAGILSVSSSLSKQSLGTAQLRTASAESATMSEASGWPYLPQGSDYILTTTHKLTSESSAVSSTVGSISVGAPDFSVSLGASYTSYDEYAGTNGIAKNVGNANGRNSETLYNVSASWTISEALLNNENYKTGRSTQILLDGTAKASPTGVNSHSIGNITGLTIWKAYELMASVSFDGVTKEAVKTHHITGLPYSAMPNNTDNYKWAQTTNSSTDVKWNYEYRYHREQVGGTWWNPEYKDYYYYGVQLMPSGVGVGTTTFYEGIYFDSFHVPQNIYVSIDNSFYRNGGLLSGYYLYCGSDNALINEKGENGTLNTKTNLLGVLKPSGDSSGQIKIEAGYGSSNSTSWYLITSISVRYR